MCLLIRVFSSRSESNQEAHVYKLAKTVYARRLDDKLGSSSGWDGGGCQEAISQIATRK